MTTILCKTCSPRKGCFVYQNGGNRTECKFYQPLTNEEYIRSCSTEELVKILCDLVDSGILKDWCKKYHCADSDEDAVRMWLKEKHENE